MANRGRLEGVDRISSLPDETLCHILSFLSTKEAVGTSILSTRWRHLFASASVCVSNLNLELDDQYNQHCKTSKAGITVKSFLRFANRVLLQNRMASIEKLHLKCGVGIEPSCAYHWISAALRQGVQHLDLQINIFFFYNLPTVLFSCKTLVTLKLEIKFHLHVPKNICLPMLKTLYLKSIQFRNNDSVERLLSSSQSLEDLLIEHCDIDGLTDLNVSHQLLKRLTILSHNVGAELDIVIDAPSLVYFKYAGFVVRKYKLLNLQSLVSADVKFYLGERPTYGFYGDRAVTKFFKGIRNVQS